jgi:hypothetical protein
LPTALRRWLGATVEITSAESTLPLEITKSEAKTVQDGKFITKVIYRTKDSSIETMSSSEAPDNPVAEAEKLGKVLAILRIWNDR